MKKVIISIIFISIGLFMYSQESVIAHASEHVVISKKANWQNNFEKAKKLAIKQNKPLLVFFTGSDWCGPCKKLHKDFFETEKFIDQSDKDLILYKADFPRRKDLISLEKKKINTKLKLKYKVRGFPTIIILNVNGTEIDRRVGYGFDRNVKPYFDFITKTIKAKQ